MHELIRSSIFISSFHTAFHRHHSPIKFPATITRICLLVRLIHARALMSVFPLPVDLCLKILSHADTKTQLQIISLKIQLC